jgi:hypothetical protein
MKSYNVVYLIADGKNDYKQEYNIKTDIDPFSILDSERWAFRDLFYNEATIQPQKDKIMIYEILLAED